MYARLIVYELYSQSNATKTKNAEKMWSSYENIIVFFPLALHSSPLDMMVIYPLLYIWSVCRKLGNFCWRRGRRWWINLFRENDVRMQVIFFVIETWTSAPESDYFLLLAWPRHKPWLTKILVQFSTMQCFVFWPAPVNDHLGFLWLVLVIVDLL